MNYPDRASDQWMWTPAINRERRVATQDRRARFFGTDFSFEDLEERDIEQYDYALQGEDTIDGEPCWKIAATPKAGKRSQYSASIYWIRKSTYTVAQIENFEARSPDPPRELPQHGADAERLDGQESSRSRTSRARAARC